MIEFSICIFKTLSSLVNLIILLHAEMLTEKNMLMYVIIYVNRAVEMWSSSHNSLCCAIHVFICIFLVFLFLSTVCPFSEMCPYKTVAPQHTTGYSLVTAKVTISFHFSLKPQSSMCKFCTRAS